MTADYRLPTTDSQPSTGFRNPQSAIDLVQERIRDLRENTDFLSTVFESLVSYAIIAADFDGNIIAFNEGARQIYGYAPEEVIGKHNIDIFFPDDFIKAGKLQQVIDDLIAKGRYSYEGEKVRKNEKRFPAQVLFTLTKDKNGKVVGLIEIVEDLAERKRAEEQLKNAYGELRDTHVQLLQASKMAAMGEMAAGVVHELTQPLLGIKGFANAMLEDMKRQMEISECGNAELKSEIQQRAVNDLEVILQQTERMTAIVNNVRDFARASGAEMALLDINQPIEDALMLFSEQLRLHNITVEKNLAQSLPHVMGNSNHLQQVFINLIANARDAIDAKGAAGSLMVSTRMSSTDASILIEFADNGIGADAETVSQMFEPFFTTKPTAKGVGLGLSIIAQIIEQHGGTIELQSELSQGCKFNICLPVGAREEGGTVGGGTGKRR